jgi:hypothetical protein
MTRVMLGQGVVPMLLLTVHGHVHPIVGAGAAVGGPVASCLARGLHVSLGRGGSTSRGLGALMMSWGLGRGGNCHPRLLSCLRPFRKAQVGWRLMFVDGH